MSPHRKHFLQVIVPQFILGIAALIHLVTQGASGYLLAAFVAWFLFYVMGEGVFYHRYFSHRTFECHHWIAKFFTICAMLGGFGGPMTYRGVHTGLHHANADKDRDPHSPVHGFWHAFLGWYSTDVRFPLAFSRKLLTDKFYVWAEPRVIKIWWAVAIVLALIDWQLLIYTLGLAGMIGTLFAGVTNSICHIYGTRRFEVDDNSRNIWWWSWIVWQGSGALHNNHHAQPWRYHDSHAWYEFDIGKWVIPLIATKIRQHPEKP